MSHLLDSVFSSDSDSVKEIARKLKDELDRLTAELGPAGRPSDLLLDYLVKNVQARTWDLKPRMCHLVFMAASKVARNMKMLNFSSQHSPKGDPEKQERLRKKIERWHGTLTHYIKYSCKPGNSESSAARIDLDDINECIKVR
jgi:hypothetical protein